MKLRWFYAVASAAMLVTACSSSSSSSSTGDGGGGGGGGTCNDAADAICDRACTCSGDGQCRVISESDAGASTVTFKSKDDCLSLYKNLGCANGGNTKVDYGKCTTDIEAAACGDSTSSSGGKGVINAASCDAK